MHEQNRPGTIERAMQLARDSSCGSVSDIKRTLAREGHGAVDVHLSGASIRRQLTGQIAARKAAARDA